MCMALFQSFADTCTCRAQNNFNGWGDKTRLCLLVSVLMLQTCALWEILLVACSSHFCAFCWRFCCLNGPRQTAEVLSSVAKCKKQAVWPEKLPAGMHYYCLWVQGQWINNTRLNKVFLNRNTRKQVINCLDDENVTRGSQELNPECPQEQWFSVWCLQLSQQHSHQLYRA